MTEHPRDGADAPAPQAIAPHERRSREDQDDHGERAAIDPPPFWGSWGRIYFLVAGLLAIETLLFWWLSRWAS